MKVAARQPASISVVLPVLMRHADCASVRLLRRALESVLDQAYPGAFEILVIDDGSPVPVREVMKDSGMTESPGIRWLRSDRNDGLVHALNTGLGEARYELIARIDADDGWLPGKIAAQTSRFADDPDLSLIATGMTVVDAEGRALESHVRRDGWENVLQLAVERGWNPFPHGSVVALTGIYRLLGGYSHETAYRHCEDYHLWSNWIRFFKPAMVEAPLYEYRRTPGAVSEKYRDEQMAATQRVHRRLAAAVDWRVHPRNMRKLACLLRVNLLQCGAICYRIWRYRPVVRMPAKALDPLRHVLPDRDLHVGNDGGRAPIRQIETLADGFSGAPDDPAAERGEDVVVTCSS